jgi:hypothetical protein
MADSIPCPKCGRPYVWDGERCCRKECRFGSGKKPRRQGGKAKIVGVYSVAAPEPVHLIELVLQGDIDQFDFGEVTQEEPDKPKTHWQVAYDDQLLDESEDKICYVFFFHYLDLDKPLLTPMGPLPLPKVKRVPPRLKHIQYEAP